MSKKNRRRGPMIPPAATPKAKDPIIRVKEPDRARLDAVVKAEIAAQQEQIDLQNKLQRAAIRVASATQDKKEFLQELSRRYELGQQDMVAPDTGLITRVRQVNQ